MATKKKRAKKKVAKKKLVKKKEKSLMFGSALITWQE